MVLKESLERMQLLRYALDIVQPIHSHDDLDSLKPPFEHTYPFLDALATEAFLELSRLDTDRVCAHVHVTSFEFGAVGHRRQAEDTCAG